MLLKIRRVPGKRFGAMKLQTEPFAHVGVGLNQEVIFPVTLTQADVTKNLQPLGTSPELWAARQELLSPEDVKLRQCELGATGIFVAVSHGLAPGYLRPTGSYCLTYQFPSMCGCLSYQLSGDDGQGVATGKSIEVFLVW